MSARKDGRYLSSHGYIVILLRDGTKSYEHTLVAEFVLGRPLRDDEAVHHVNGERAENQRTNLLICKRDYHVALHARLEASPDWPEFKPRILFPRGMPTIARTGFKGVERLPSGVYLAYCTIKRRKHRIGRFSSPKDAALAYDAFVVSTLGANWITNHSLGVL